MRTPPVDAVELRFVGPAARRQEAIAALKTMGFLDVGEAIPRQTITILFFQS